MNELDLKELLKLAEQTPSEEIKEEKEVKIDEAQRFIIANEIKVGDTKISAMYIYDRYCIWKKEKPLSNVAFFQQFSKYFKKTKDTHGSAYMLDPEGFDLSKDKYFALRRKLRHKRMLNKKNKKFLQKELKKLIQGSISIEKLIKEAEEKET